MIARREILGGNYAYEVESGILGKSFLASFAFLYSEKKCNDPP